MAHYKVKLKVILGFSIAIFIFNNGNQTSADTIVSNQNPTIISQPQTKETDIKKNLVSDSIIEKIPSSILDNSIDSEVSTHNLSIPEVQSKELSGNNQTSLVSSQPTLAVVDQVPSTKVEEKKLSIVTLNSVVAKPQLSYSGHVENIGWQEPVLENQISGTTGKALQLEAINISLTPVTNGSIVYSTLVQGKGWQPNSMNGQLSGTTGLAIPLEAICINLTDDLATIYDIYYRVHIGNYGWLDWAKNGAKAGSEGLALHLEAYELMLLEKNSPISFSTKNSFLSILKPKLTYQTHVETIGWQNVLSEGNLAGTTGQNKQVEAIKLFLDSTQFGNISYKAHVQDFGWQNAVSGGQLSGTTGLAKQMEAIQIKLTGQLATIFSVKYRVHVQDIGWQNWVFDDEIAGTIGKAKQIEAIEIFLVDKAIESRVLSASQGNYDIVNKVIYLDAGHGGYDPGAVYFGTSEKTLNLQMQTLVKSKLEAQGYTVVTTRTDDTFTDLLPRSEKANNSLSDLFVSLHFNASTSSQASGIETYYYEYYKEYPSRINEIFHNDPERLSRSSVLAEAIQAATTAKTGAKNNGVLRNTFAVLRETTAPAVLVELGYMSNASEFQNISNAIYQEKLAQGIVSGILSYYQTYSV